FLAVVRPPLPSLGLLIRFIIVGVLFVSGYAVFLNTGELTVQAGAASFILQVNPVLVALLAIPLLGERVGPVSWVGTLVSFGDGGSFSFNTGALLVFGAAACAAIASVMQKPMLHVMPPIVVTAWLLMLGSAPLLPVMPRAFAALGAAPASVFWAVAWLVAMP